METVELINQVGLAVGMAVCVWWIKYLQAEIAELRGSIRRMGEKLEECLKGSKVRD